VKSIVLSAGTITDVVVEPGNINWAIHAGYFYFGDDNDSIQRVKLDGTGLELVSQPFDIIWSLAVDDAHVVLGSYQSIFQPGSTPNSLNTTLLSRWTALSARPSARLTKRMTGPTTTRTSIWRSKGRCSASRSD
jgi:hypothetical protein